VPTSPRPQTAGWPSAKTLALSVWHPPPAPILESSRASCSSPRNSLGGRPQGLRQRPGDRQRRRRIQFGRHDAHHVPARIYQCPARIARLHRQADLEIARVIRRARQRRRGNAEGRRMNEELTPSRAGCRLVSSFFILPSSFAFDPPWPPSRPVSPCDWRQSAAVQTAQRLSTKPNHSPHQPFTTSRQSRQPAPHVAPKSQKLLGNGTVKAIRQVHRRRVGELILAAEVGQNDQRQPVD